VWVRFLRDEGLPFGVEDWTRGEFPVEDPPATEEEVEEASPEAVGLEEGRR